jgi:hypothetical protein
MAGVGDALEALLNDDVTAAVFALEGVQAAILAMARDDLPRSASKSGTSKKPRKRSAYQTWAAKERPKIVKQHPRFSFGRINVELGKRWKREKKRRGIK